MPRSSHPRNKRMDRPLARPVWPRVVVVVDGVGWGWGGGGGKAHTYTGITLILNVVFMFGLPCASLSFRTS